MPRKPACGTTTPLRNSKPFLIVKIGNTACMTLIDTGSSLSLMSFELWDRYFKQAFPLSEAEIRLTGAGGNGLEIKGKIKAPVTINSKRGNDVKLDLELVVVKGLKAEVIAGMDWLTAGRSSLDLPRLKLTSFGEEFELITACGDNTNSKPTLVKNANDVKIEPQQSIEIRTQAMLQGHTEGRTCMISKVQQTSDKEEDWEWLTIESITANLIYGEAVFTINNESKMAKTLPLGATFMLEEVEAIFGIHEAQEKETSGSKDWLWAKDRVDDIINKVDIGFKGLDPETAARAMDLIRKYADVFALEGEVRKGPNLKIKLSPIHNIPVVDKNIKIGLNQLTLVEAEIEKMVAQGVLRPSDSAYNSRMFLLQKGPNKPGEPPSLRMVNDYRSLNRLLPDLPTPLDEPQTILASFGKSRIFGILDLKSSYHQLELDEASMPLTSFSVNKDRWMYTRLPMGLRTSSYYLVTLVKKMIRAMPKNMRKKCLNYVDDFCLHCEQLQSFLELLEIVFQGLREYSLFLKPSKCHVLKLEVKFLGFIISENKCAVDPSRIETLLSTKVPTTMTQIRSVLGAASYLRAHISDFEERCKGLRADMKRARKKKGKIRLSEEGVKSFHQVLEGIAESCDLSFPQKDKKLYLYTDSSESIVGGCLIYFGEDKEPRALGFYSKKIPDRLIHLHIHLKELWGIIQSVEKFQFFLKGARFTIRTDSKVICAPKFMANLTDPSHKRWLDILHQYQFDLEYVSTATNISDFLTRKDIGTAEEEERRLRNPREQIHHKGTTITGSPGREPTEGSPRRTSSGPEAVPGSPDKEPKKETPEIETPEVPISNRTPREPQDKHTRDTPEKANESTQETGYIAMITDVAETLGADKKAQEELCGNDNLTLVREQQKDPLIAYMKLCVEKKEEPNPRSPSAEMRQYLARWGGLEVHNNLLWYRSYLNWDTVETPALCLPLALQKATIAYAHSMAGGGHLAIQKLTERIQERFFFPNLEDLCRYHVMSCLVCEKIHAEWTKDNQSPVAAFTSSWPNEKIALDTAFIKRSVKRDPNEYNYVMIATCTYSGFMITRPLKVMNKDTILFEFLTGVLPITGSPSILVTDQGNEYNNNLFKEMALVLGIRFQLCPVRRPQANRAEASVKALKAAIKKTVASKPETWTSVLGLLTLSINCSVQRYSHVSAHAMYTGRRGSLPLDALYGTEMTEYYREGRNANVEFYHNVRNMARCLHAEKLITLEYSRNWMNKNALVIDLKPGDWVLIKRPIAGGTRYRGLQLKWAGPYRVLRKVGRSIYTLQDGKKYITSHQDHLKLLREVPRTSEPMLPLTKGIMAKHKPVVVEQEEHDHQTRSPQSNQEVEVEEFDAQKYPTGAPLEEYFKDQTLEPVKRVRKKVQRLVIQPKKKTYN